VNPEEIFLRRLAGLNDFIESSNLQHDHFNLMTTRIIK
jgi:hypothetical protein